MRQEKLRRFLALEQQHIDRCVEQYFGYYLLLLGDRHRKRVAASPVQNHFVVSQVAGMSGTQVVSDWKALPFAPNSVDVIVLLHATEQTDNLNQLLTEMDRLLRHDGHLVIVGFNPWRPVGRRMGRALYGEPWLRRYSISEVLSELSHVGFSAIQRRQYGFYLNKHVGLKSRWERLGRWLCAPFGLGYCLVVEKKTATATPLLSPSWVAPVVGLKPLHPSPSQSKLCSTSPTGGEVKASAKLNADE